MITEDHTDAATTRLQDTVMTLTSNLEKNCHSPCSSTSPSPSPSAHKSSTECSGATTTSSSDEGDGITFPRNGVLGSVTPDGVLTPPIDLESQTDATSSKPFRCNGRLEFYKEGVLCLELSHCEEGQGRKWLKTKGKSDLRQVVRVSKEVSIPCSPSPPNQIMNNHPPNGLSIHDNLSDEGSSAGSSTSSPKSRDKSWRKQTVPQKCISRSLEFYMSPSPCIHGVLSSSKKRKVTLTELTPRRPYALPQFPDWQNRNNSSPSDFCDCGKPKRRRLQFRSSHPKKLRSKIIFKRKLPVEEIVQRLRKDSSDKHSISKVKTNTSKSTQSPRSTPHKFQRQYSTSGGGSPSSSSNSSSRKRSSKEIDDPSEQSRLINFKKSPIKNLEKTILSVPGIASSLSTGNQSKMRSVDATDGNSRSTSPPTTYDHKKYAKSHAGRSSPYSLLRPAVAERTTRSNEGSPLRASADAVDEAEDSAQDQDPEDLLTPEERQQYAMSRAISYTITSLLSQGTPSSPSSVHAQEGKHLAQSPYVNQSLKPNPFGLEQEDKKSFLRHLLDTSDPIPNSTTHASLTPAATTPIGITASKPNKPFNQSPDKPPQKSRNPAKGVKRSSKVPLSADNAPIESRVASKSRNNRREDSKIGILNHAGTIYGGGAVTPPASSRLTPPVRPPAHHPASSSSYSAFGVPSPAQLESITAAAMQYACLIPPHPRGKVAFSNPSLSRIQPPIPPPNSYGGSSGGDEAPINLSQKDGDWPDAKQSPNERASRLDGRAFPIVPHENLNEESDPDLPLDLCKKRRDD